MGRVFEALDISVGVLQEGMNQLERRENLLRDVTYVTAQSLCFTYLFDQTSQSPDFIVSLHAFPIDPLLSPLHSTQTRMASPIEMWWRGE